MDIPFPGGNTLPSEKIVKWAVNCLSSKPELPITHQISSAPVLSQVFELSQVLLNEKRVCSTLAR